GGSSSESGGSSSELNYCGHLPPRCGRVSVRNNFGPTSECWATTERNVHSRHCGHLAYERARHVGATTRTKGTRQCIAGQNRPHTSCIDACAWRRRCGRPGEARLPPNPMTAC